MDSTLKIANCMRASARDVGLQEPTIEQAKNIIGLGLRDCMQILFPHAKEAEHDAVLERYRYHFVTADNTEQGLFGGIEQGLKKLDDAGVMLAVATGKSRVGLDRVFANLSIASHFTVTRCADETHNKPNPQMLHEILDFTAIDVSKAIMVGDTSYDMDMAANASMDALGVSYGAHTEETLYNSKAITVQHSANDMFAWLLDGRVEKAHG